MRICGSDNFAEDADIISAAWLLYKLENKYKGIYYAKTGRQKKEETKWRHEGSHQGSGDNGIVGYNVNNGIMCLNTRKCMLGYPQYALYPGRRTEPGFQPDARCSRDQGLELSLKACPKKGT